MSGIKWKVCGLRDNISEVMTLQPDYVGFIFYKKSPRYVGEDFMLPEIKDTGVKKVGVFVNESSDFVLDTVRRNYLDFVQLHGDESSAYCEELKRKGIKIIKAFSVGETFKFDVLNTYEPVVDFFLFDTPTSQYGGSGKTFNWSMLKKYNMNKQYFLSGGIGLENIEKVKELNMNKIHSLDVNSRFEVQPGLKDIATLEEFKSKIIRLPNVIST